MIPLTEPQTDELAWGVHLGGRRSMWSCAALRGPQVLPRWHSDVWAAEQRRKRAEARGGSR